MQLDGSLDTFPLRELIEMVVYSSVTGVLELRVGSNIGQLFFRDGQPYHAEVGAHTGMEAVVELFAERKVPFRFVADPTSDQVTIWLDPWELIERGEQQASQWSKIRQHIADLDLVPTLRVAPVANQVHIDEGLWPVLAGVDGQRTVAEIAEHLNLMTLDTCIALKELMDQGLIEIGRPRTTPTAASTLFAPPNRRVAAPAVSSEVNASRNSSGFLERLLADAQAQEQERPDLTDDKAQDRKRVTRYVDDRR